jgi:hypothetical protein
MKRLFLFLVFSEILASSQVFTLIGAAEAATSQKRCSRAVFNKKLRTLYNQKIRPLPVGDKAHLMDICLDIYRLAYEQELAAEKFKIDTQDIMMAMLEIAKNPSSDRMANIQSFYVYQQKLKRLESRYFEESNRVYNYLNTVGKELRPLCYEIQALSRELKSSYFWNVIVTFLKLQNKQNELEEKLGLNFLKSVLPRAAISLIAGYASPAEAPVIENEESLPGEIGRNIACKVCNLWLERPSEANMIISHLPPLEVARLVRAYQGNSLNKVDSPAAAEPNGDAVEYSNNQEICRCQPWNGKEIFLHKLDSIEWLLAHPYDSTLNCSCITFIREEKVTSYYDAQRNVKWPIHMRSSIAYSTMLPSREFYYYVMNFPLHELYGEEDKSINESTADKKIDNATK